MKKNVLLGVIADAVKIYWWALLLVLAGFVVAYKFVAPPPPREITISTGSEAGGYHRFGLQLKAALEKKGLKVNIRSSAGTIENLKRLSDSASGVSVAFGQGGAERLRPQTGKGGHRQERFRHANADPGAAQGKQHPGGKLGLHRL